MDAALEASLREALLALGEDAAAAPTLALAPAHRGLASAGLRATTPRGRRLYVKVPVGDAARAQALCAADLFRNEAAVYRLALPAFQRIGAFTAAPRCLAATEAAIVLEDMAPRGFVVPNRLRGLGLDQLRLLVQQLGRFQAASLAIRTLDPTTFRSLQQNVREVMYTDRFLRLYAPVMEFAARDAVQTVGKAYPGDSVYVRKLLEFAPSVTERLRSFISQSSGDLAVLTHGDLWASNLLYRYSCSSDGVQVPEEVCIVDFQTCRWAPMGLDVAYVLLTAPPRALGAAEWSELVGAWEASLRDALSPLGLSALAPPRATLERQLAAAAPYALGAGLLNVVLTLDEGRAADWAPPTPGADEGDALAEVARLLKAPFTRQGALSRQRVVDLVISVVDRGFL